ncbi:MAG: ABC transporter permease [Faecalibacterium prausnitzii]
MAAFRAELQKAHRRHDLALCLFIPGIVVLWVGGLAPADPEELANGYSALLYSLPVIEAILMPVMMAVLASRLWDMEIKGNTAELLYTLQSRRSLFAGKAVFGVLEVLLVTVLELACVPVLGRVHGYTEAFPTGQLVYLFVCTLAVDTMLFFGEFLLMLWVGNPLPALCVGIVGALVGLFSAFMPPLASYFVPFGYYIPLSAYRSGELGQGHPHRHLRHPPLQLGAAGLHPCAGRCAVCPCVAQGTGRGGIKPC